MKNLIFLIMAGAVIASSDEDGVNLDACIARLRPVEKVGALVETSKSEVLIAQIAEAKKKQETAGSKMGRSRLPACQFSTHEVLKEAKAGKTPLTNQDSADLSKITKGIKTCFVEKVDPAEVAKREAAVEKKFFDSVKCAKRGQFALFKAEEEDKISEGLYEACEGIAACFPQATKN